MAKGYDFIVVGAGSAGCVVANRLSANGARVLLLEAGGDGTETNIRIPAFIDTLLDSPVDWGYRTVGQDQLLGRRIFLSRGKCLGGTSAINAMVYMRGTREDFDHWHALGNPGWSHAEVLPYYRKSEANQTHGAPWHGTDGSLTVSSFPAGSPIHQAFVAAAQEVGHPYNPDVNGATQAGCGPFQATIGPMGRCSTAVAFLNPIRDRANLHIRTNAHVTSLMIEGGRATGVRYLHMGREETAQTDGEVVLCGGALNSPQLLLLSGVGPAADLTRHGIAVHQDLPGVGQNLHDHLQIAVRFQVDQSLTIHGMTADQAAAAQRESLDHGTGPYHTNFCESGGFLRCADGAGPPDVQIHCESHYSAFYFDGTPADRHGFGMTMNVSRPKSRGAVSLHSANPLDRPLIDPRYLADPEDLELSIRGVRACLEIGSASALKQIGTRPTDPAPDQSDDAGIEHFIRRHGTTIWHPVGTCKMGQDAMAVVDDRLRVHGIANLRVADASIMPRIVSGNTNATCIMIGEKVSDLILGNHPPAA